MDKCEALFQAFQKLESSGKKLFLQFSGNYGQSSQTEPAIQSQQSPLKVAFQPKINSEPADASSSASSGCVEYPVSQEYSKSKTADSKQLSGSQNLKRTISISHVLPELKHPSARAPQDGGLRGQATDFEINHEAEVSINFFEIPAGSLTVQKVDAGLPVDDSGEHALSSGFNEFSMTSDYRGRGNVSSQLDFDFSTKAGNNGSGLNQSPNKGVDQSNDNSKSYSLSFSLSFQNEIEVEIVDGAAPNSRTLTPEAKFGLASRASEGQLMSARSALQKPIKPQKIVKSADIPEAPTGSGVDLNKKRGTRETSEVVGLMLHGSNESEHSIMSQSTLVDEQEEKLIGNSSLIQPQKLPETISVVGDRHAPNMDSVKHMRAQLIASTNKLQPIDSVSILENENEYNLPDMGARSPLTRMRTDGLSDADNIDANEYFTSHTIQMLRQ